MEHWHYCGFICRRISSVSSVTVLITLSAPERREGAEVFKIGMEVVAYVNCDICHFYCVQIP